MLKGGGAARYCAALCRMGKGVDVLVCVLSLLCGFRGNILAPHVAAAAAAWLPPAAKEG